MVQQSTTTHGTENGPLVRPLDLAPVRSGGAGYGSPSDQALVSSRSAFTVGGFSGWNTPRSSLSTAVSILPQTEEELAGMDEDEIQRVVQEATDLQLQINKVMQLAQARMQGSSTNGGAQWLVSLPALFYIGTAVMINVVLAIVDIVSFLLLGVHGDVSVSGGIWRAVYRAFGAINGILAGAFLKSK